MKLTRSLGVAIAMLGGVFGATGQVFFSDNFDSGAGDAANWNINSGPGNNAATFGFDYSSLGIPSAPHSTGGGTIGVKLESNYATPAQTATTGISISPKSQSFAGDFVMKWDFWSQYVGNANGLTGSGTTQLTGAGIGTSGTTPQHAGIATTSLWFAQTADGGNSAAAKDFRIYSSAASGSSAVAATAPSGYAVTSGFYAAGTGTTAADNANAYYASLGNVAVPAGQTSINTAGTTPVGAPGFAWHTGTILKLGNTVSYSIDNLLIATVTGINTLTLNGSDIELIYGDINTGVSTDTTSNFRTFEFGLMDNLVVAAPEPATWAIGGLGAVGLCLLRRRRAK